MDIVLKKTSELSLVEIEQICHVFRDVFLGHDKSVTQFKNEFSNTELGFSYHILLLHEGVIVGAQSYIPFTYLVGGEKFIFALSVDTMIAEEFRNFDCIFDMWSIGREALKKEGVAFLFGFPNENAYPLLIKALGAKEIGNLVTYVLPYKVGAYFPKLKCLNFFSKLSCRLLLGFSNFSRNNNAHGYLIKKDRETFDKYRYKWFDGKYNIEVRKDFSFVYKIAKYNGIRTAFLMDVYPLTPRYFDAAVRIMFSRSHSDFEVALYVGYLHFLPFSMIKVPKKYEPKTFHFVGEILDKGSLDANVLFNIHNWDVNLSNYDLL